MSVRAVVAAVLAGVVSAAAVVAMTQETPHPEPVHGKPETHAVTAAHLECPGVIRGGSGPAAFPAWVRAVAPISSTGDATGSGAGRLAVVGAAATASPFSSTSQRGSMARETIGASQSSGSGIVSVAASGALAPGVAAVQVGGTSKSSAATAGWCLAPRSHWFFTGADTSVGGLSTLVVANPGGTPAVVGLRLFASHGPVRAAGTAAIGIAAHSRRVIDLSRYAPDVAALAVEVVASRGAVTAALLVRRQNALVPAGVDWLPPATAPGRRVLIGAGLGSAGVQSLVVANPGRRQQVVSVRLLSAHGAFVSTALRRLQVPAGSVVVRPLSAATEGAANAVELLARGPVTGSVESDLAHGSHDVSWSAPSPSLDRAEVVCALPGATLSIAFAVDGPRPAKVRVQPFSASGSPGQSETVSLPGNSTTAWKAPSTSAAYYVVTRVFGSGIMGTAAYRRSGGIAQLPLLPGTWTVSRPIVLP